MGFVSQSQLDRMEVQGWCGGFKSVLELDSTERDPWQPDRVHRRPECCAPAVDRFDSGGVVQTGQGLSDIVQVVAFVDGVIRQRRYMRSHFGCLQAIQSKCKG